MGCDTVDIGDGPVWGNCCIIAISCCFSGGHTEGLPAVDIRLVRQSTALNTTGFRETKSNRRFVSSLDSPGEGRPVGAMVKPALCCICLLLVYQVATAERNFPRSFLTEGHLRPRIEGSA